MPERRGTSRLLALDRATGATKCTVVSDLPRLLDPGDLLVVNDTRVFPAGLLGMTGHIGLTRFAGAEGPRLLSPSTSLGASTI